MKPFLKRLILVVDVLLAPFVIPSAYLLKIIRRVGVDRLSFCRKMLLRAGVFPIRDHYYEPLFDERHLRRPLSEERSLPGIDWNKEGQLELLNSFAFTEELKALADEGNGKRSYSFENEAFKSGDAEYWYNMIRLKRPSRIIEIGSGSSTLMAQVAIEKNRGDVPDYECAHICIEPYEQPWLEEMDVTVLRKKVEEVDKAIFRRLGKDDILFIDSSHVIRPQGDILFEYLELLPQLNPGVIVHIHDIFSPRDYLAEWIKEKVRFWNEQYLLEALLTSNPNWRIIGALNYLQHNHYRKLESKCPFLTKDREPGSFYIQKVG